MNRETRKVKSIQLRLNLEGDGVVNYDDKSQKYAFLDNGKVMEGVKHLYDKHDNVKYAKKHLYVKETIDEKGDTKKELKYKLFISSECLKSAIYKTEGHNSAMNSSPLLKIAYIATPEAIAKGYLITASNSVGDKKKSVLSLGTAEQICDAKSTINIHNKRSEKQTGDDNTKADNSLFKKEEVGKIKYLSNGTIDLQALQFISMDLLYDRKAFDPDMFNHFKKCLQKNMPSFDSDAGYVTLKRGIDKLPEYGVLLSNDDMLFMVKYIFEEILSMEILRAHAYARRSSLEYKLIYDAVDDNINKENGWVKITSTKQIDDFDCDFERFYKQEDTIESEEIRKIREDFKKEEEEAAKSKKAKGK